MFVNYLGRLCQVVLLGWLNHLAMSSFPTKNGRNSTMKCHHCWQQIHKWILAQIVFLNDKEIVAYCHYVPPKCGVLSFNVLKWWKLVGSQSFPSVAFVAKKYLSVGSSSCRVERLFKKCKDEASSDRTRMKDSPFKRNIFLESNCELMEAKWF